MTLSTRMTRTLSALAFTLAAPALLAQDPQPPAKPAARKSEPKRKPRKEDIPSATVVVSATRTERTELETPVTVSIATEKEIERKLVTDIVDLIRHEPGVEVAQQPDRQGASTFNIRGIGGNRVLILVDGVSLPDGAEASRGMSRDFVDLDSVKRVEILRGSGSAMYGSDALAGVVTYTTLDAADLLGAGKTYAGRFKTTYASANDQTSGTLMTAGRRGAWDGILVATRRQGHELTPATGHANPLTSKSLNLLGKVAWQADARNRFTFGVQSFDRDRDMSLDNLLGPAFMSPGTFVIADQAQDWNRRRQFSVEHVYENDSAWLQRLEWRLFRQAAKSMEHTIETRERRTVTPYAVTIRYTDYVFDQTLWGLRSQAEHQGAVGGWANRLSFGLDATHSEVAQPYDRTQLTVATGALTHVVAGQAYPVKLIPDSTTTTAGAFLQGEFLSPGGTFSVVPGLRYDLYKLTPHPDAIFDAGNVLHTRVVSISNGALSPKLGLVGKLNGTWSVFGQYAQGFRNPPYDFTNFTMTSFASGYRIIPNPDLKPEHSRTCEGGVRGEGSFWSLSLGVYHNRFRDFITDVNLGPDPESGVDYTFQYRNLESVRIKGAELKAGCVFLGGWRSTMSVAYAEGQDGNNNPINTVSPLRGTLGIGYRDADRWGVEGTLTAVAAKRLSDIALDVAGGYDDPFRPAGYGKIDLIAFCTFKAKGDWRFQAGLFNLTDRTVWRWEDVRGWNNGETGVARYSQPGRNVSVSLSYAWR